MSTSKLLAGRLSGLAVLGAAALIAAPLSAYGDTEPAPAGAAAAASGKTPVVTTDATVDTAVDTAVDTTAEAPAEATADTAAKTPAATGAAADAPAASADPVTGDALAAPVYASGTFWGIIGRNTLNGPSAVLREGPYGRIPGQIAATQSPPYGTGSLGLIVDDAANVVDADKIMWGNERIFANDRLSSIRRLSYWVYAGVDSTTGLVVPNITIEVDPNIVDPNTQAEINYTSLVYLPNESDSPSAPVPPTANLWQRYDALASGNQWFATGAAGNLTGCTLASPCSWAQLLEDMPNARISYSLGISKGRDTSFVGAVDGLRVNGTVYDFEFDGVRARPA